MVTGYLTCEVGKINGVCQNSTRYVAQSLAQRKHTHNLRVVVAVDDFIVGLTSALLLFLLYFLLLTFLPTGIIILVLWVLYTDDIRDEDPEMTYF